MSFEKIAGYILYAVGIVGGMEGVFKNDIPISVVAFIVIVIGSYLLARK